MSRHTVKIYTLPKTQVDQWLMGVEANGIDPNLTFLHGIFTYDWFAFVKALRNQQTGQWSRPSKWTSIPFPLAFVAFGTTDTEPRDWLGPDDD